MRRVDQGYLLAWTSLTDRGDSLTLVGVSDAGAPRARAIELSRTTGHVVWVETVRTPRGAVCVWAEEARPAAPTCSRKRSTRRVDREAFRAASRAARLRGRPSRRTGGVALGIVSQRSARAAALDSEGASSPGRRPSRGASAPTWTSCDAGNRSSSRGRTVRAGSAARPRGPRRAAKARRAARRAARRGLVVASRIMPAATGRADLWERSHKRDRASPGASRVDRRRGRAARDAHDARFSRAARRSRRAHAATGWDCSSPRGYARRARALHRRRRRPTCASTRRSRPCRAKRWCRVLPCRSRGASIAARTRASRSPPDPSADESTPRPRRAAEHDAAPVPKPLPEDAPRLGADSTLANGVQVADVASALVGETTLVASLVSSGRRQIARGRELAPRHPGPRASPGAHDALDERAPDGRRRDRASSNGKRSRSRTSPKTAAARASTSRGSTKGRPPRRGASLRQRKGEASDVSIAAVDDGYVVAWVDTRDGNGEVYAEKLRAISRS